MVTLLNVRFSRLLGVSFHPKKVLRNLRIPKLLEFNFEMAGLRCFFAIKINLVQCILCGQYILADRFLRNSGYLVEHEILLTYGCQFPSKGSFEKSKNTEVCLNLTSKWRH